MNDLTILVVKGSHHCYATITQIIGDTKLKTHDKTYFVGDHLSKSLINFLFDRDNIQIITDWDQHRRSICVWSL